MALSDDAREWLDQQEQEFMQPFAEYFGANSLLGDDSEPIEHDAGWYSRLSASGYLDCTDWLGPYATEDEALQALFDTFGD